MRIAVVTNVLPPQGRGGAEHHVAVLAASLHDRGHEVTVLSGTRGDLDGPRVVAVPRSPDLRPGGQQAAQGHVARRGSLAPRRASADLGAAATLRLRRRAHQLTPGTVERGVQRRPRLSDVPHVHMAHDYNAICMRTSLTRDGEFCGGRCPECRPQRLIRGGLLRRSAPKLIAATDYVRDRHVEAGVVASRRCGHDPLRRAPRQDPCPAAPCPAVRSGWRTSARWGRTRGWTCSWRHSATRRRSGRSTSRARVISPRSVRAAATSRSTHHVPRLRPGTGEGAVPGRRRHPRRPERVAGAGGDRGAGGHDPRTALRRDRSWWTAGDAGRRRGTGGRGARPPRRLDGPRVGRRGSSSAVASSSNGFRLRRSSGTSPASSRCSNRSAAAVSPARAACGRARGTGRRRTPSSSCRPSVVSRSRLHGGAPRGPGACPRFPRRAPRASCRA